MTANPIAKVLARRVWDSRGRPTVEAEVHLASGAMGRAIAPAGASRGTREAIDLRDGGERLGGLDVMRAVDELSPGERTRAGLALLQARGINLLVLDEPTNHLDLPAIEQLEQALESYEGTLLLVTHDRRMLATVQTDRQWRVEAGQVVEV